MGVNRPKEDRQQRKPDAEQDVGGQQGEDRVEAPPQGERHTEIEEGKPGEGQ